MHVQCVTVTKLLKLVIIQVTDRCAKQAVLSHTLLLAHLISEQDIHLGTHEHLQSHQR